MDSTQAHRRIDTLANQAGTDRATFQPPAEPPAEEQAMHYLREGAGPAIWLYVDARVDGFIHIESTDLERLESAMNIWLELYAACYGVDISADFTVRTAAELLLETHNIRDTAAILTKVGSET